MDNISNTPINLLPFDGEMYLYDDFFSTAESDYYYQKLLAEIEWKHEDIKLFGKPVKQPRLTAMYGEIGTHYAYSGIDMPALQWTDTLKEILEKVRNATQANYNIALLNQYRNEADGVGWHRDHEKGMGATPTIASISFGETRDFEVRRYKTHDNKIVVPLSHGSLILMRGDMQRNWEHRVPQKPNKKLQTRINITFRYVFE